MIWNSRKIALTSLCCLVTTAALSATVGGTGERLPPLEVVDVSESVVMLLNDHGSNITCIALDSGLVFVDAGLSTEAADRFREIMEERFQRPAETLVLTHGHLDHIFGIGAFADLDIVAAEAGRSLIEKQLSIEWNDENIEVYAGIFPTFAEDVGTARPLLPTTWVAERLTLGESARTATFQVTGGHTTDSAHVYFPSEGVLVAGDLVQVDKYPYFGDSSNDLDLWIQTLKQWQTLPISSICPGHGHVVERGYLAPIQLYFEKMVRVLTELKGTGVTMEEVVVHPSLPDAYWPDQPEPRWWKMCIARAYSKTGT